MEEEHDVVKQEEAEKKPKTKLGVPFYPHEVLRYAILTSATLALLFFLSAWGPPRLEEPADPYTTPKFLLPDWYLMWWYGILKLWIWDVPTPFGTISAKIFGNLIAFLFMGFLTILPFIDRGRPARPMARPRHAAIGVGTVAFIFTTTVYSANEIIMFNYPSISREMLANFSVLFPVALAFFTYWTLTGIRKRETGAKLSLPHRLILIPYYVLIILLQLPGFVFSVGKKKISLEADEYQYKLAQIYVKKSFTGLEHEVIDRNLCTACGVCEAVCPENVIKIDEFPRLVGDCTNCGYCLVQCPRLFLPRDKVEERLYG